MFLDSKITAGGDCNCEIRRHLLPGRKAMTNLDSILKSRDITLPTKVHLVKVIIFPVVMYGELDHKEGWVLKNWCYWVVMLEKTLESPLDSRRSNQSILKEINSEYSLKRLVLKLKPQYVGHLMQRANSWKRSLCWESLKAKGERGSIGWDD